MRICKYALLQIRIIANTHYCDPDSSPLSTSDSELCLSTLNSHTENWVWDYFQSALNSIHKNHKNPLNEAVHSLMIKRQRVTYVFLGKVGQCDFYVANLHKAYSKTNFRHIGFEFTIWKKWCMMRKKFTQYLSNVLPFIFPGTWPM